LKREAISREEARLNFYGVDKGSFNPNRKVPKKKATTNSLQFSDKNYHLKPNRRPNRNFKQ